MAKQTITLTDGYLHFPVCTVKDLRYVEILDAEENMLGEFHVGALNEEPYSWYPLKLHGMEGKKVELVCRADVPED